MSANLGTAWIQVKPSMDGVRGSILGGLRGTGAQFGDQMGDEVKKSSGMTVGMAAVWGAASAVAFKAIDTISRTLTDSISGAIRRVDTLNNSERTFANMGFNAQASSDAIKALDKSIRGLPTPLDQAIRGMTSLAATYGDVSLGQKMFTALNNAILGFGGTVEMVDNAILQISQMPMDGPLDAQTWNSLRNSGLTPVLVAMSKEFGISVSEMKKQFGEGELKVQDFVNALIKMNKDGGGGLKSLEQIAKDSTAGINTGMANAQTAVERGMAAIIQAVGSKNISNAIASVGKAFEVGLQAIAAGITALPKIIDQIRTSLQSMIKFVQENAVAFGAFGVAIIALTAPMAIAAASAAILDLRIRAMLAWDAVTKAVKGLAVGFRLLGAAMAANPIGVIIAAVAVLTGAFLLLWKNNEGFRNFFIGAWNGIKNTFGTVSAAISKWVTDTWGGLLSVIGTVTTAVQNFVTAGLNILTTTIQNVVNWFIQWRQWFINIGIVIGTVMLPMLTKLTIEMIKTAASAVASAAQAAGAWIAQTARAAAQTAVSFVQMSIQFVRTAVTASVQAAIAGAAWVKQSVLAAAAWLRALPQMIAQFVTAGAAAAKNALIAGAAWIQQASLTLLGWAKTFIAYGIGVATAAAQTLLAGARMAAGWLLAMGPIGLIVAAVAGAVALIIANWDAVKNAAAAVWQWIQQAVANVINWITQNWPLLLGILMGPIGLAIAWIIQNFDTVKAFIAGVWQGIQNGAAAAWNFVKGVFSGVVGFFSSMFSGALNAVKGIWNGIGSFFSGIPQMIKNAFGNLADIGRFIVQGIANGLNPQGVINKMKELASSALSAVKSFLGIKSPSRVMRDQVGKMLGEGMAIGIDQSTRTAVRSAQASSAAVLSAYDTNAAFNTGLRSSADLATPLSDQLASAGGSTHIENVNIASDYDADRLLKIMGVKQGLYSKGVIA